MEQSEAEGSKQNVTVSVAERSPVKTVADESFRLRCAPLRMTILRGILRQAQNDIFYVRFEAIGKIHSTVFGMMPAAYKLKKTNKKDVWKDNQNTP